MLVSGSGSNLQALIDASGEGRLGGAEIVLVVSDLPGVKALDRAEAAGIPTRVVRWEDHGSRADFTAGICDAVEEAGADVMVLAGFMRILDVGAIRRFPDRILNVHPALLPSFPGARAVEHALAHGVKVTGVTVHFVDEEVDHGPIIAQEPVRILDDDDQASLHARLQEVEHRLYPEAVAAMALGRLEVSGRRVIWR